MLLNNLKFALRNIIKHRQYVTISVLGLAIGFTAFVLISLFLKYEYSWDAYNENYSRIYRVQVKMNLNGKENIWAQTPAITPKLLAGKFPEIEKVTLVKETWGKFLASSNCRQFH